MKKIIPILFLITGLGVGAATGLLLGPSADEEGHAKDLDGNPDLSDHGAKTGMVTSEAGHGAEKDAPGEYEYLKLTKQFVVPVVEENEVSSLVTMSLSLETRPGISEAFYEMEPKLRDGFLRVLFDHANIGGFNGEFTRSDNLDTLRKSLLEVARKELGDDVSRVLIMSVNRQDT